MKNDNKALESIGIAVGVRGVSQKTSEAPKRWLRARQIDQSRCAMNTAKRLLMGRVGARKLEESRRA
jgi:hypothetical protein